MTKLSCHGLTKAKFWLWKSSILLWNCFKMASADSPGRLGHVAVGLVCSQIVAKYEIDRFHLPYFVNLGWMMLDMVMFLILFSACNRSNIMCIFRASSEIHSSCHFCFGSVRLAGDQCFGHVITWRQCACTNQNAPLQEATPTCSKHLLGEN